MATKNDESTTKYVVPAPPKPTTFPLKSPRGAKLVGRTWPVVDNLKTPPKALLLIVHGGGWHSGYFEELAKAFQKEHIFVASYDQVCCGYSEREPGAPEGCMHIGEFGDLIEDLFEAVRWAKLEAGVTGSSSLDLPVYLFGESFGGLQVLLAALDAAQYKDLPRLSGVIVSGALIEIAPGLLPPRFVVSILSFLVAYYPKMKMPATDMSSTFDAAFGDKKWAALARSDSAISVSVQPTLAGAVATVTTGETVAARASEFPIPLLAIHGVNDCRTLCSAVQKFVDEVGPEKAEGYWIEGTTGHQLLQDQPHVTNKVIQKSVDWVKSQL